MKSTCCFFHTNYFPYSVISGAIILLHLSISPVFADFSQSYLREIVPLSAQIDTFVTSEQPTTSFATNIGLWVGNRNFNNWGNQRSLLQFEIPRDITSTTNIQSATLRLYMPGFPIGDQDITVQVFLTKASWNASVTWDSAQGLIDETVAPVSITIPAVESYYQWDIAPLLRAWVGKSNRTERFGILLRAADETTNHFRGFWSNECPVERCFDQQPKFFLEYVNPPPTDTPTSTPTNTPTATRTPTPAPGFAQVHLSADSTDEIKGGEEIAYTIKLQNGALELDTVVVSNQIPEQTNLLLESTTPPAPWAVTVINHQILQWTLDTMPASGTAEITYRVVRQTPTETPTPTATPSPTLISTTLPETLTPTPPTATRLPETVTPTTPAPATPTVTVIPPTDVTVTPTTSVTVTVTATPTPGGTLTGLVITKGGTDQTTVGGDIVYVLRVTNYLDRPLTALTLVDYLPVGVSVVDLGGGSITLPPAQFIQWQIPLLSPKSTISRSFAVRVTESLTQIENNVYFVDVVENGQLTMRSVGAIPVRTVIVQGSIDRPPLSDEPPLSSIYNRGATVTWIYNGLPGDNKSNPVWNPFYRYFIPLIAR